MSDERDWIHCPDKMKREQIASDMKAFRERMHRPGSGVRSQSGYGKLKMPPTRQPAYNQGLQVSAPPDAKFPMVHWQ